MNYHTIKHCDMANGTGCRSVLFVSGCSHHCKGCHNPETHDKNSGALFDEEAKKELLKDLSFEWCSGITFSGGDPLFCENRETILSLCKEIKENYPNKTIWLYTGFTYDEIKEDPLCSSILRYIDILVDGRFVLELKKQDLKWRGSENQKIIDIKNLIINHDNK